MVDEKLKTIITEAVDKAMVIGERKAYSKAILLIASIKSDLLDAYFSRIFFTNSTKLLIKLCDRLIEDIKTMRGNIKNVEM